MADPAPLHPAARLTAPARIEAGVPLKDFFGPGVIGLIAESLAAVHPAWRTDRFIAEAGSGLADLGLLQRAAHIGAAMARQLPADFPARAALLVASFGPPLGATAGNGLAPFFYLPHSTLIAAGAAHPQEGLAAVRELTRRFTAEFAIRPYLATHRDIVLARLHEWAADPDPHIRRLVSEGTRPRLPWASRLPEFQRDPQLALPLLERLKDDAELYVRRSVANHLGDIAKDHPAVAFATARRWAEEAVALPTDLRSARHQLVRHAVRLPAKQGVAAALRIRRLAAR